MTTTPHLPSARADTQKGTAAVEFALIAIIMIVMLMGILVSWRAFQAQQSLTRAAGDGARAILGVIALGTSDPCHPTKAIANQTLIQQRVEQTISQSLQRSAMPGNVVQQLSVGTIQWQGCPASGVATFELHYQLPPLLGTMGQWLSEPSQLSERSVVHFASLL